MEKGGEMLRFELDKDTLRITEVAGLPAAGDGSGLPFALKSDAGAAAVRSATYAPLPGGGLRAGYTLAGGLEVAIVWQPAAEGILQRTDTVTNTLEAPYTLYGYAARTALAGAFEIYSQANGWTAENQGRWEKLTHGARELAARGARTCLGCTPYLALRQAETGRALAVHLLADGDWAMRVSASGAAPGDEAAVLQTGPAAEGFACALRPGESLAVSRCLLQALPGGAVEGGAAPLHRHLLDTAFYKTGPAALPVIYNTWFFDFDNLDETALAAQLEAAAALGCEGFVVDAGWYGRLEGRWYRQTGDWREKQNGAFYGQMRAFADRVRAKGLFFGVWMEPERYEKKAPAVLEHPGWFYEAEGGLMCPDLDNEDAAEYVYGSICEVIDRYGADWVKIDFNHALGPDPHGRAHMGYMARLRRMLDDLRAKYPRLVLEGCASGGMRLEIETQRHYGGVFMSDSVNPWDVLRIGEGAALRLLPGRIIRWCCFRSAGEIPVHGQSRPGQGILVPRKAVWDDAELIDVDFALKVCMQGHLSFSGNLAGLDAESKERIEKAVGFVKKHREKIHQSEWYPLTPPALLDDRTGWSAALLWHRGSDTGLLFCYRLSSPLARRRFGLPVPRGGAAAYKVEDYDTGLAQTVPADTLRDEGLAVEIAAPMRAALYILRPAGVE